MQPYDPIRLCIFTTIALLAWLFSPPIVVMAMSGLGMWAYIRAWRGGLRRSKCFLRDPRLIMGYLGAAFTLALVWTIRGWVG
jgi:hypothetical protein